ncbi:homeobox protein prospero, partial [Hyalella azteca]|uniref:Homeobox protein prospero n=1 Tax=Hyalella azteca TaxID=294128 RepID=A0A8B7P2M9_HYAAZ
MENIVTVVILIVGGALLAIIVSAICGKRKLQRHKEFSRKDPHVPGSETHKALRVEIERRVERVREIKYDPLLLSHDPPAPKNEQDQYFSRMKALDHLCYLERELSKQQGVTSRVQHETLRGFLVRLTLPVPFVGGGAVLQGLDLAVLHQLCDLHARYHPQPFTRKHLTDTHALMLQVLTCAKSNGRKHLGSEDRLRASSDHDSAIDADPSEIEQSDDDVPAQRQQQQQLVYTSLRQQQKQQQLQQHKQQQLQQQQQLHKQQQQQQQQQQLLNKTQPIH